MVYGLWSHASMNYDEKFMWTLYYCRITESQLGVKANNWFAHLTSLKITMSEYSVVSKHVIGQWPFFRSMYYIHGILLNAATDKQSSKVVVNGLLALAFWRSFLPDKRTFSILGSDNIHCTETWLNKTLSSIPSFVKGLPSKPERWACYLELEECLKVTHLKKELLTVMSLSSFCC